MVSNGLRLAAAALALLPLAGAAAQEPAAVPPFVVRAEFSELRPWERSQVIYTVRVYRPAGARRTDRIRRLDEPVLLSGEALIQRLGNDREYTARPADTETLVLVRRYAIFPQSPGELRLMPVSLQWIGGEFGFRTRRFAAAAEPERLEVRAVPSPPAGKWLAAGDVRIWDEFERPPDELRVGEPLVRLLGVRVEGQPARQIPELSPGDGPNFRHFIERAEFEDQVTVGGLVGVRRQRAALLASRAGDVVLPAIRLDWWDTSRQRWATAELPQRILEARGPPAAAGPRPPESGAEGATVNEWLLAALAAGWLLTAAAWWASRRFSAIARRRREWAARLAGRAAAAPPALARSLAALAAACRRNDAQAAGNALLAWSRARWAVRPPRSLDDLARRCGEPLAGHCRRLSAALYAAPPANWDPAGLLSAVRAAPPPKPPPPAPARALPPLWPEKRAESG